MKIYYDTVKYMDSVYYLKWKLGGIPKVSLTADYIDANNMVLFTCESVR